MVKIVWTEVSILDLNTIHDFIAADSQRYASLTVNKIYKRVQVILDNPYIGRIVPEFNEKLIRELIEGNYRIIYRIKNPSMVDILRVYHSSRFLSKTKI